MDRKTYTSADIVRCFEVSAEIIEETYWELNATKDIIYPNKDQYDQIFEDVVDDLNTFPPSEITPFLPEIGDPNKHTFWSSFQ